MLENIKPIDGRFLILYIKPIGSRFYVKGNIYANWRTREISFTVLMGT